MRPRTPGSSGRLGPTVAGRWYPNGRRELELQVDGLIESCMTDAPADFVPRAIVAPHAGFIYSGSVAASAFRQLRGVRVSEVILIGPSHYAAFPGAALSSASAYATPLGDVPLSLERLASLSDRPGMRIDDDPFLSEHSLEAEIPFLQRALEPGWRLLPVLVGAGGGERSLRDVARSLRPLWDAETLVVISSDFTHYGRSFGYVPFEDRVPERIEQLDMEAVRLILGGDEGGFAEFLARTGATICGQAAIRVLMAMAPTTPGCLTAYDTSGRITGGWDHSVSYASLVFDAPPRN